MFELRRGAGYPPVAARMENLAGVRNERAASMRALEIWRLLLCQWFRTAEPHAIRKAQAMQSVVAKRLAIRHADLALMRAAA